MKKLTLVLITILIISSIGFSAPPVKVDFAQMVSLNGINTDAGATATIAYGKDGNIKKITIKIYDCHPVRNLTVPSMYFLNESVSRTPIGDVIILKRAGARVVLEGDILSEFGDYIYIAPWGTNVDTGYDYGLFTAWFGIKIR